MDFQSITDREQFFTLLQFLAYAQNLEYNVDYLGSTPFRQVSVIVKDFITYKKVSNNYYQLKKMVDFFDNLQKNLLIKFFSSHEYRSLVVIPEVKLKRGKYNSWIADVWITEELFYYTHPFLFPDFLKKQLTKDRFETQFKVIQTFSSIDVEKVFNIEEFFEKYPSVLSNSQKTRIKKYFIELIQILEKNQLIKSKFKVIDGHKLVEVEQLVPNKISQGFVVYEKLII